MTAFGFTVAAQDGAARAGRMVTAHGPVDTPAFMPVGTAATVKAMTPDAVAGTGADMVLGNTYHLMLRPGADRIEKLGGLHRFMAWPGPILTDSGGFQVMSLAKLRTLDEDGVTFQSHIDGSRHRLTPESSVDIQRQLGATITMAFDECTSFPATEDQARDSMELSMRWAARSKQAFLQTPRLCPVWNRSGVGFSGTTRDVGRTADRNRLRWLRNRRTGRGRGAGGYDSNDCLHHRSFAGGSSALSHGRRPSARPRRGGPCRGRYV